MDLQTLPEPSQKTSSSESDELLELKRLTLVKANAVTGRESPEQIESLYERWKSDRDNAAQVAEQKCQEQAKKDQHEAILNSLRVSLRRLHVDPEGMSQQEMNERLRELLRQKQQEDEAQQRVLIDARRRECGEKLFANAGCPQRHVRHLDDQDESGEWLRVRDMLFDRSGGIDGYLVALLGARGTGKTQLAVSLLARCCLESCLSGRYVKALDLFRDFRRAYTPVAKGAAGESEQDILDQWVGYDVLAIDDAHQRGETAWEQNTLVNLLDRRYDADKSTVLIANQSKEEFAAAVGDSIVSRIHETGEAIICTWPSWRRPGQWMS